MQLIHEGEITVIAHEIESIDKSTVAFADGSKRDFDAIIWATGFNYHVPAFARVLVPELVRCSHSPGRQTVT